MSTTVVLRPNAELKFDGTCVVCGHRATSSVAMTHEDMETRGPAFDRWHFTFGVGSIDVPTCRRHWPTIASEFWLRRHGFIVLVLLAMIVVGIPLSTRGYFDNPASIMLILVVLAISVPLLIGFRSGSPHFASEAWEHELHVTFRSARSATAFANANSAALLRFRPNSPHESRAQSRRKRKKRR